MYNVHTCIKYDQKTRLGKKRPGRDAARCVSTGAACFRITQVGMFKFAQLPCAKKVF